MSLTQQRANETTNRLTNTTNKVDESLFDKMPTVPIAESTYYKMSNAVSEAHGTSNEAFRIARVREVYPGYDPDKMIKMSEARIPADQRADYMKWRNSLTTKDGTKLEARDYDYAGAWMAGSKARQQHANGHFTDEFKLPHHTTFSTKSRYAMGEHDAYAPIAGTWSQPKAGGEWHYAEGPGWKTPMTELYAGTQNQGKGFSPKTGTPADEKKNRYSLF